MGSAQRGQCRTLAEPQLGKLKISCSSSCSSPSAQCWKRQGDQNRCTGETEGSSRSIQANISHNWRSTPEGTWQPPLPCIAITCVHGQKRQLPTSFPLHLLHNVNTRKNLLVLCTVHIMFQHMAKALWLKDRIAPPFVTSPHTQYAFRGDYICWPIGQTKTPGGKLWSRLFESRWA